MSRKPADVTPDQESPYCDLKAFQTWGLLIVIMLFCALAMEYLKGDLWMDELLTLIDYGGRRHWSDILRQYQVANNHILYSIVLWFWLRVIPVITEEVVRFPNLLLALVSIIVIYRQGRQLFGNAAGFLLMLMWAFSPIYLAFFYQVRGYGLTLLLALLATLGAFHLLAGKRSLGLALFVLPAVLLPVVIPSNILLNFSLVAYLVVVSWRRHELVKRWPILLLCAVAGVSGMLVYVPIWEKFVKVAQQTSGWSSGWAVVLHWGVSLAAHLGFFVAARLALEHKQPRETTAPPDDTAPLVRTLPWLLICCLVPLVAVALFRAPFPRSLLAYLAPLTFCAFIGYRPVVARSNRHFLTLVFFLVANGLVFFQMTHYTTERRLRAGEIPQNLLQQFYSRNNDVSQTVRFLVDHPAIPPHTKVFIDFHQYLSLDFNWKRFSSGNAFGYPQWRIECLNGTAKFTLKQPKEAYPYYPQLILAYDEETAKASYRRTVGYDVLLEPIQSPSALTIYHVVGIKGGAAPSTPFPYEIPLDEGDNIKIQHRSSP